MAKYHIAGKDVKKCTAFFRACPYTDHFRDYEEATRFLDERLEREEQEKQRKIQEKEDKERADEESYNNFNTHLKAVEANLSVKRGNEEYSRLYKLFNYVPAYMKTKIDTGKWKFINENSTRLITNINELEAEVLEDTATIYKERINYFGENYDSVNKDSISKLEKTSKLYSAYKELNLDSERANFVSLTNTDISESELADKIIVDENNNPTNLYFVGIEGRHSLITEPSKVTGFTGYGITTEMDPDGIPLKLGVKYDNVPPETNFEYKVEYSKRAVFVIDKSVKGKKFNKNLSLMDKTPTIFDYNDRRREDVEDYHFVDTTVKDTPITAITIFPD